MQYDYGGQINEVSIGISFWTLVYFYGTDSGTDFMFWQS